MKTLLTLLIVLIASTVSAWDLRWVQPSGGDGGGDSCTDGLVFSAHFETDENIDTAVGCVDGVQYTDTTGTDSGANVSIVTGDDGYVLATDTGGYIEFDVASFSTSGSMLVKFEVDVHSSNTSIIYFWGDADNNLYLADPSDNDLKAQWKGNTSTVAALQLDAPWVIDTPYWQIVRWQTGDTDPAILSKTYNMAKAEQGSGSSSNVNLTAMTTSITKLRIGSEFGTGDIKIYSVKLYDSYAGASLDDTY